MINIKKLLKNSLINDYILLWTGPTDDPVIKSVSDESARTSIEKDFTGYILGNMILGKKS